MTAIIRLIFLTLPTGLAGCYSCPALRPYQFGPMHNPDVTAVKPKSALKPKVHQPLSTGDV